MFIPHPLNVATMPQLRFFPLNILFGKRRLLSGHCSMGLAWYEPDISSFKVRGRKRIMTYRNACSFKTSLSKTWRKTDCHVEITCMEVERDRITYLGEKFVGGESVGSAAGCLSSVDDERGWDAFFTHLTLLGLSKGEPCMFVDANELNE